MSDCCNSSCSPKNSPVDPKYRRILWIGLAVNAATFGVEIAGGLKTA